MHGSCTDLRSMQQLAGPSTCCFPQAPHRQCPILTKVQQCSRLQLQPATVARAQRQFAAASSLSALQQPAKQQQYDIQQLPVAAAQVYEQIRTSSAQLLRQVKQQQHHKAPQKPLRHDTAAAALLKQLKAAATSQDFMQLVQHYQLNQQQQQQTSQQWNLTSFNSQLLSGLLSAAVKLQPPASNHKASSATTAAAAAKDAAGYDSLIQAAFHQALLQLPGMQPRELSNIIWAASKLHNPPESSTIKQLLAHMTQEGVLAAANAQDVSMCLYAAASLGIQVSQQQMEALLDAAARQLNAAAPQALANTLWAVAVMQYRPSEQWLTAVEHTCCLMLQQQQLWKDAGHAPVEPREHQHQQQQWGSQGSVGFSNKGLHQLLWSMAKLQWVPNPSFLTSFWDVTAHQLPSMTPHGSTGLLWAAATLELQPPVTWIGTWFKSTLSRLQSRRFGDQDLALALWAFVKLGLRPEDSWLQEGLAASERVLSGAGSQELAMMLWGLAKLGFRPTRDWMALWQEAMYKRMSSYCAPGLACSAYSLAVLRYKPSQRWCQRLVAEMQRQMPAFGAQELANIVWALAKLGLKPNRSWFRDFEVQALNASSSFNSQELAVLCWSLAKLNHTPPASWVAALLRDGLEVQSDAEGQSMVRLMWALGRWRLPEIRANGTYRMLLPRYWAASQQLLGSCSLWQLSVLWWARVQLGCMPNRDWSNSFYKALVPALTAALQATGSSTLYVASSRGQISAVWSEGNLTSAAAVDRSEGCCSSIVSKRQVLQAAVVIRLVSATSKMPGAAPPAVYELLFEAAQCCMPRCKSLSELAVLGLGLLRLQRLAATAAVTARQQKREQLVTTTGTAGEQHGEKQGRASQRKAAWKNFEELLQKHAAVWKCWFACSSELLRMQLQHRQEQQHRRPALKPQSWCKATNEYAVLQAQQQENVSQSDAAAVSVQLFLASQLAPVLQPPSEWLAAVMPSVLQNMQGMSLENLGWVLWAAVELGMLQYLQHGVVTAVLTKCNELLDENDGEADSAHMLRLNRALKKLRHRRMLADADWDIWNGLLGRWSSNHGLIL